MPVVVWTLHTFNLKLVDTFGQYHCYTTGSIKILLWVASLPCPCPAFCGLQYKNSGPLPVGVVRWCGELGRISGASEPASFQVQFHLQTATGK